MSVAAAAAPGGILDAVADDMGRVAAVLQRRLSGEGDVLSRGVDHLVNGGGKRLRPALVCLVHGVFGGDHPDLAEVAAVGEVIHAATLAHDDVIDEAQLRRGKPTLRAVAGNHRAVLVGDFLFAEAYGRLGRLGHHTLAAALADTICELVEGELIQLERTGDLTFSQADYEHLAGLKTGSLFGWAARAGATLAGQCEAVQQQAADFARHVGIAFQITDDLLDVSTASGKDTHLDLLEGKMTLPLIIALRGDPSLSFSIQTLLNTEKGAVTPEMLAPLAQAVSSPLVREACLARAGEHLAMGRNLLAAWPAGPQTQALSNYLDLVLERTL